MVKALRQFKKGILDENPIFSQAIALCPVLAVTTSIVNGIGLGLATLAVLLASTLVVCFIRHFIPAQVRIPCFIVVSATFTTVVSLLMEAFFPALNDALGIFIPLIVVNCLILARMEAFAAKNPPLAVAFDSLGMGLGFTLALAAIGAVRELMGFGTVFGLAVIPEAIPRNILMILPPGGFFVLAFLIVAARAVRARVGKGEA
ncbi:MAG: electron transport complex subunit RsxE [Defluviitaleaceae bacterium]|nr:electron transport complex subunit RsxE [Defluviitaleaceae bacterium]MCL2239693.1 electron transport complex subunit RsxE [Defluviitaleaceae bacterium]